MQQLLLPAQRDLRVRVPVDYTLSDRELFFKMPTGDVWNDAGMKEVFEYLITSRHCRTVHVCCWGLFPLQHHFFFVLGLWPQDPTEWQECMEAFRKDLHTS